MRYRHATTLFTAALAAAVAAAPAVTRADVTIQQQSSFDIAIVKAHGTSTEYTTSDKQRREADFHCEGFMSMFCGNTQSAEIVRLDRNVEWTLEPKKKQYRETAFMTEAERQAAQQQAQAMMEKVKQCPAMQQQASAPDTSKCEMSPPQLQVKQPGTHAMFAGHDTQLTQLALSRSCTNKETGDVCQFVFALDSWLTQDQIAGLDDHKAFQKAYLAKLGIDPNDPMLQKQVRQFLAPYADSLKDLSSKAGDFKGYPLKTVMRIGFGGEHCGAAKNASPGTSGAGGSVVGDASQAAGNAAASSAAGAAGSAAGAAASNAAGNSVGGNVLGSAASAFGSKLVGGLFSHKKSEAPAPTAAAAAPDNGLGPGMVQAAAISIETTAITPGTVPAAQFEIPADYKLIPPQPAKASNEFKCPNAGG
ncbi:MAG TPA: hypothetical protein VKB72_03415 [Steroidobacteraceae bacterium]|nr:hypothetical protein [Steroidobacteraceae bacterium]